MIVVKENVTSSGLVEKDEEDSSVTRPSHMLKELFQRSELRQIAAEFTTYIIFYAKDCHISDLAKV